RTKRCASVSDANRIEKESGPPRHGRNQVAFKRKSGQADLRNDLVSVVAHTRACMPSCTPAVMATCLANGGSGHADTMNPRPERSASVGDLRDQAVRLMNRRDWHCFYGC